MLQTFSHTLIELYETAENVEINAFPAEVVRLLGKLVGFDGAVLGMGEATDPSPQNLVIQSALVHGRDPEILSDYAQVSMIDPMTHRFLGGLSQPLASSVSTIEPGRHMNQLRDFYNSHDLQHLLLFGEAEGDRNPARWLVLYRGTGDSFDMQARQTIAAVWPHLARCLSINRSRFLQQQFPHHQHKGLALINSSGFIEVAEPLFRQLCALEWPTQFSRKVPDAVWNNWRRGLDYAGARVKFKMHLRREDFIVSQASAIGPLDRLTPAERVAATRFAAGQSAKTIAYALGLSVHTVRSQISQVYEKLDIHDKGQLASYLLADAGR
jgi:DNA-binding CsgD family transcriptional regulator